MKNRVKKVYTGYIWANTQNCKACWKCVNACPKQAIEKVSFLWHKHIVFKNSENCNGCKKCIKVCPYGVFSDKIPDMYNKKRVSKMFSKRVFIILLLSVTFGANTLFAQHKIITVRTQVSYREQENKQILVIF